MGKVIKKVARAAMAKFKRYDFPGNIRELENIVERGIIMSTDQSLEIGDWLKFKSGTTARAKEENVDTLKELQRKHLIKVLQKKQLAGKWKRRGCRLLRFTTYYIEE